MSPALRDAGLRRVNVSLDTLVRERFHKIARRDRLHEVLEGLAAARAAGFTPVKVNAVLMRGENDEEIVPLARWARGEGYEPRFIEALLRAAVLRKLPGHLISQPGFVQPARGMSAIGG